MKKLPKTIYVQYTEEGSDLNALPDIASAQLEDGSVGVYELKEVKTRRTEIHLD
jgi:hypothetical protein